MKRKLIALLCIVALAASLTACGSQKTKYTIGICQLVTHPALDSATQGFKDAIVKALGAENVTFLEENAAGEPNTCADIANSFVSKKVDLIMANATPALQACAAATDTIPVLATSITEYGVALGIENFNGTVGGNVSGTSDLAPLDKQADMILEWFPEAKTVGLLYCTAENNSLYQVNEVARFLAEKNIEAKMYAFTDSNDVASYATKAATECDVIYIPTDNTAASNADLIKDSIGNTPVIAGEEGICSGCGVATLSISYYDIGYRTGEMAVEILSKGANISTMPISYATTQTPKYNAAICAELGLTAPAGYEPIQ